MEEGELSKTLRRVVNEFFPREGWIGMSGGTIKSDPPKF